MSLFKYIKLVIVDLFKMLKVDDSSADPDCTNCQFRQMNAKSAFPTLSSHL